MKEKGCSEVMCSPEEVNQLRVAKMVVDSAIHPDTGEMIAWPMRVSSYIPLNMPIVFGLLATAPTPFNTILFQWGNQSVNAGLNYGNRNATSLYTTQDVIKSYCLALVASCSVSLGIRKALSGYTKGLTMGPKMVLFNSISAVMAGSAGGVMNCYMMRQTELQKGIDVFENDDFIEKPSVGKSVTAAKCAVFETAMSRVGLAMPLFTPGLVFMGLHKLRLMPTKFWPKTVVQMIVFFLQQYFTTAFAMALFS